MKPSIISMEKKKKKKTEYKEIINLINKKLFKHYLVFS